MIIKILTVIGITFLGMAGGQVNKALRRFVLPSLAVVFTSFRKKKYRLKALVFILLSGILSIGYGEHSGLRRFLGGSDFWTRIVVGLLVSIPFLFFGKWYATIVLPVAWSIRAGGFKIGWRSHRYDWLWEDFIRYGSLGVLVVI